MARRFVVALGEASAARPRHPCLPLAVRRPPDQHWAASRDVATFLFSGGRLVASPMRIEDGAVVRRREEQGRDASAAFAASLLEKKRRLLRPPARTRRERSCRQPGASTRRRVRVREREGTLGRARAECGGLIGSAQGRRAPFFPPRGRSRRVARGRCPSPPRIMSARTQFIRYQLQSRAYQSRSSGQSLAMACRMNAMAGRRTGLACRMTALDGGIMHFLRPTSAMASAMNTMAGPTSRVLRGTSAMATARSATSRAMNAMGRPMNAMARRTNAIDSARTAVDSVSTAVEALSIEGVWQRSAVVGFTIGVVALWSGVDALSTAVDEQ